MNDEFETRLSKRLSALDAAVPVALADVHGYSGAGSPRREGGSRRDHPGNHHRDQ